MKNTKLLMFAACLLLFTFVTGCADFQQVPNGNVGKRSDEAGLGKEIFKGPAAVDVYDFRGKKRVICLENSQYAATVEDRILCQDKMNLPFRAEARFGIPRDDDSAINTAFSDLSPDVELSEKVAQISNVKWYNTYARAPFLATAKGVLAKYETMEVGMVQEVYPLDDKGNPDYNQEPVEVGVDRDTLNALLKKELDETLKGSPVECLFAAYTNFEYPGMITTAIEENKEREIAIEKERSEQKKRLVQKQNEEALAQYNYRISVLDALKVADSNRIIGDSVSLGYLWYLQTKVLGEAATGPNNWGFIPYTAFESQAAGGMLNAKLMDEMLGKRLTDGSGTDDISDLAKKLMKERPKVTIEDVPEKPAPIEK